MNKHKENLNKNKKIVNIITIFLYIIIMIVYEFGFCNWGFTNHYIFKGVKRHSISMHVLRNGKTWNNVDDVEYYEISEETFNDISKLYDERFKKCEH